MLHAPVRIVPFHDSEQEKIQPVDQRIVRIRIVDRHQADQPGPVMKHVEEMRFYRFHNDPP